MTGITGSNCNPQVPTLVYDVYNKYRNYLLETFLRDSWWSIEKVQNRCWRHRT